MFDFVCTDAIFETLEFFKSVAPGWRDIKTFVIDKEFPDPRILERCFPQATLLLCQFRAVEYWVNLLQQPRYGLKIARQDDITCAFMKMVYSATRAAYETAHDAFVDMCDRHSPLVLAYFEKEWTPCRRMWTNFERDRVFSAGSGDWNQFRTTNRPTTLDELIHRRDDSFRQMLTAIRLHEETHDARSVPPFLRMVSPIASDYVMKKIQGELDSAPAASGGCPCHFHASTELPCRHIMSNMEHLPADALPARWSMRHSSFEEVPSKDGSRKVVRIKKQDVADQCAQLVAPLLKHLSSLQPGEIDSELERWRGIIKTGLREEDAAPVMSVEAIVRWSAASSIDTVAAAFEAYPIKMDDSSLATRQVKARWELFRPEDYAHPFVIPKKLVDRMMSLVEEEVATKQRTLDRCRRLAARRGDPEPEHGEDLLVNLIGDSTSFSRLGVYAMNNFYLRKAMCRTWAADLKWISKDRCDVRLFDWCDAPSLRECALQVGAKYKTASFGELFKLKDEGGSASFDNIVGAVAQNHWLNDIVIEMCCRAVCSRSSGFLSMQSHAFQSSQPRIPTVGSRSGEIVPISQMTHVVLPVCIRGSHWGVIVVELGSTIVANLYEPFCSHAYRDALETRWRDDLKPFLEKWYGENKFPPCIERVVGGPVQPPSDSSNCGVFVIGFVDAILAGDTEYPDRHLMAEHLDAMRLRILWLILCKC